VERSPHRTERGGAADRPGDAADRLVELIGAGQTVPCLDGTDRVAIELDQAASTQAHPETAARVEAFLPWYSSVHRGAGFRSRHATASYEQARSAVLAFAGRDPDGSDVAILCRNTTEAINQLAFRLRLAPTDVVVTTVVEHHANLLPWGRVAQRRYVECTRQGTFTVDDVCAALDRGPGPPALLTVTGASNVTGWLPPIEAIIDAAHERGVRVVVDGAQLAPHRPLPPTADFIAFSGHKLYAPFGSGALIGPRSQFETGEPFLAGGGAVDLVGLDEVVWTAPPEREEAGSPNVVGAVALHASIDALGRIGWERIVAHEDALASKLVDGLAAVDGVHLLGPPGSDDDADSAGRADSSVDTLPVVTFTVEGMHQALVAARLSAEYGIAVRHGCFCAHPYVVRLLGLADTEIDAYRSEVLRGDHRRVPGAVRASAGLGTSGQDIDALVDAIFDLAGGKPQPVPYQQDRATGDYFPVTDHPAWRNAPFEAGAACARG
jgi:selenocysteine lyase/cysteine desulfurase